MKLLMNIKGKNIPTPFEIQSLLALKEGIKPVLRKTLPVSCSINDITALSDDLGLFVLVKKLKLKGLNEMRFAYFSIYKSLVENAYEAEKSGDVNEIQKYGFDKITNSYLNTKTKPSLYCNNLFNFESKLFGHERKTYQKNEDIFNKCSGLFLIEHIPCSFDCEKSIMIGKRTLNLLEKYVPELAKEMANALKRPVLYLDYFTWIVFDGEVNGDELVYNWVLPYESLFPREKLNLIKQGNKIKVSDKKIQILKGDTLLSEIQKEYKYQGVIIGFS